MATKLKLNKAACNLRPLTIDIHVSRVRLTADLEMLDSAYYRKSGNFRCKNIFVVDGGYEN